MEKLFFFLHFFVEKMNQNYPKEGTFLIFFKFSRELLNQFYKKSKP